MTAMSLHAPPVEILKRATTAEDAAGHRVAVMFYADGEFMTRFGIPLAVSCYGSTEAAGVSHLHQWRLGRGHPGDASRYGGARGPTSRTGWTPTGRSSSANASPAPCSPATTPAGGSTRSRDDEGWFATGDLGERDEAGGLRFLERAAESIRVKGEFVPIPYVEERLGTIPELVDLALWKKPGELVDDDVVLYAVAEQGAGRRRSDRSSQELPAFMRPSYVAQIRAIPRDAAAGKVQRRLLDQQEVVTWTPLS